MLFSFDVESGAVARPAASTLLHVLLLTLLAATAVAALQTVGACLVVAMLVTPGATAYLLTDRFGRMLWLAGGLGAITALAGAYASYFLNGATGGCIVTLQTLVFLAALAPGAETRDARAPPAAARRGGTFRTHAMNVFRTVSVRIMREAMLVGSLIGGVCAVLSCYPHPQGLVADGRRHLTRRPAGNRAGLPRRNRPCRWARSRSGLFCAVATGFIATTAGSRRTP